MPLKLATFTITRECGCMFLCTEHMDAEPTDRTYTYWDSLPIFYPKVLAVHSADCTRNIHGRPSCIPNPHKRPRSQLTPFKFTAQSRRRRDAILPLNNTELSRTSFANVDKRIYSPRWPIKYTYDEITLPYMMRIYLRWPKSHISKKEMLAHIVTMSQDIKGSIDDTRANAA